jgi:hypothetical protein
MYSVAEMWSWYVAAIVVLNRDPELKGMLMASPQDHQVICLNWVGQVDDTRFR